MARTELMPRHRRMPGCRAVGVHQHRLGTAQLNRLAPDRAASGRRLVVAAHRHRLSRGQRQKLVHAHTEHVAQRAGIPAEVYRVKRNALERLRRNPRLQAYVHERQALPL